MYDVNKVYFDGKMSDHEMGTRFEYDVMFIFRVWYLNNACVLFTEGFVW